MKYGWIAVVAMMATLFSTQRVAAQEEYEEDVTGEEQAPFPDPDVKTDDSMSELEKLKAMDQEESTEPETSKGTDERGLGTPEAERERSLKSIGDVGKTPSR